MSDIEKIKKLREATGAGFKDCNLAIKDSGGDLDKAVEILRVKGKGFPLMGSSRRGDQLVKIQIDVPSKMNRDEKKSTEDLLKIHKN